MRVTPIHQLTILNWGEIIPREAARSLTRVNDTELEEQERKTCSFSQSSAIAATRSYKGPEPSTPSGVMRTCDE